MGGGSPCFADSSGKLLFYISPSEKDPNNSLNVINRDYEIVEGAPIKGYMFAQEVMALPFTTVQNRFHVFSIYYSKYPPDYLSYLYYHVLDMNANGGKGKLLQKDSILLDPNPGYLHGLFAIKHANGKDWWLMGHKRGSATFFRFLLKDDRFTGPEYQTIGNDRWNDPRRAAAGWMYTDASSNGDKVAVVQSHGIAELYDFDRTSGLLANPVYFGWKELVTWKEDYIITDFMSGISFSSDDQQLYVLTRDSVLQLYIHANDIISSKRLIHVHDTMPDSRYHNFTMRRGPDGKIYGGVPECML